MPSHSPLTVGAMLRAAREGLGLSVNDVAERTRIRSTLIREIEDDNFFGCGDIFYARGHVRSIAVTVGVDPTAALSQFDAANRPTAPEAMTEWLPVYRPGKTKPSARAQLRESAPEARRSAAPAIASQPTPSPQPAPPPGVRTRQASRADRSAPSWRSALLAATAVVVLLAVASFLIGYEQGPSGPSVAAPLPTASPRIASTPSATPSATPSPTPEAFEGVNIRIRAVTGSTWIKVTNGAGAQVFQGVVYIGEVKEFRDPKLLIVRFGDSSVVQVVVNGLDKGSPQCGAVVCSETYKLSEGAG